MRKPMTKVDEAFLAALRQWVEDQGIARHIGLELGHLPGPGLP
jgi:hypothetical protein